MSFGNVVELRINTKGVGGKLPNFGFVVFDDSEPVQRILIAKPIMFRGEVRLNVEEKKQELQESEKPEVVVMIAGILGAMIEVLVVHVELWVVE